MEDKDEGELAELERDRKFRELARAAGLPYSDTPFDSEEPFNPYLCDGGMTAEDNRLMWALVQADCDRLREEQAEDTRKRWGIAALVGAFAVSALALLLTTPAVSSDFTYPVPTAEPDFEIDENQMIQAALLERAHKIEDCTITWYTAETDGKTPGDPAYGITASGMEVVEDLTCAVDFSVIPMFSEVFIEYPDGTSEHRWATDTGVSGNAVDVYTPYYLSAIQNGRQTATVYWIPPVGNEVESDGE